MVSALKDFIDEEKVFFGIRESLRNANKLDMAFVPADCRTDVLEILKKNKIEIEKLDLTKKELADKLILDFECEVFGVRK